MTRALRMLVAALLALHAGGARAAQPLLLEQVLEGALAHYPEVRAAWEARLAREGRLRASEGAFDMRFEQDGYGRFSGYYDGRVLDSKIVKPLPYSNAKVYGGYSVSAGDFPVYEEQFATLDDGQVKVGFLLSLLRDRSIDERRFQVAESRLAIERAELDLAATRILVQHAAASAYLGWVAAGQVRAVQRDLLALAEKRQSFLQSTVREGNVPAISLEENLQNLLERKARLIEADRDLVDRAQALSLYLRDQAGEPRIPSPDELPQALPRLPDVETADVEAALNDILERRPEMALLDNARALEEQKLRMGKNALLPRVDLLYELKRDFGSGPENLSGTDNILGLQVEIPLERNVGEGRMAEARASINRLTWQQRLLEDRIRIELESLANQIGAARALVTTTEEQVQRAAAVEQGERERLSEGASQIFLVNAREEATANARVKLIAARVRREQSLANFYAAAVRLDRFYPGGEVPELAPPE